jgi:hypothetical protein
MILSIFLIIINNIHIKKKNSPLWGDRLWGVNILLTFHFLEIIFKKEKKRILKVDYFYSGLILSGGLFKSIIA